jgi:hypothetical protein
MHVDPAPLEGADIQASLAKLATLDTDGSWLVHAERKALKALDKIEKKVQALHSELFKNLDTQELEALSQNIFKAGNAAGRYLTHSSPTVVDEASEVLHICQEVANQLIIVWEDYETQAENPSSPLFYDTGKTLKMIQNRGN